MIGTNRTVRGVAVTSPVGDPSLGEEDERALRRRIVERAIAMLGTHVGPKTVWEGRT
jgi:hypothetical protein